MMTDSKYWNIRDVHTTLLVFIMRLLDATSEADCCDSISWRTDTEYAPVTFFINCNDLFYWGTADAETVTPENIAVLEQAFTEAESTGPLLFCARVRQMRPQGAYPHLPERCWPLFDACGPPREIGFLNPHQHPAEGGGYAYVGDKPKSEETPS